MTLKNEVIFRNVNLQSIAIKNIDYNRHGELHRFDGPARIYENGFKVYAIYGTPYNTACDKPDQHYYIWR